MEKFLLDILFEKGYKLIQGQHLDYSVLEVDRLDSRYQKGDIIFIWGLREFGKPATLVEPRLRMIKTVVKKGVSYNINQDFDDAMNECLNKFSHEDIYEGIMNDWLFDLNNDKIIRSHEKV